MEEQKNENETAQPTIGEGMTAQEVKAENWLEQEAKNLSDTSFDGERSPALKLEENKITEITVDFSKPFEVWTDDESGAIKKIIPVTVAGEKFVWWLNTRNPVYGQIVMKGQTGTTVFKILQTGSQKNTRYTLVE